MQLVGIAQHRPDLVLDLGDRGRVERAEPDRLGGGEGATQRHRPRAALLERSVVEVGPRPRADDLVGHGRGLGGVHRDEPDLARRDAVNDPGERGRVHRLAQAVAQRLRDERVIGDLDRAGRRVVLARDLGREHRREEVVRAHPGDRRGHPLPLEQPRDGERARRVPAPPDAEHRSLEGGLREHVVEGGLGEQLEDGLERERVLRAERQEDALVGGGGLQLEVEAAAEALAEREAEGAVRARAERRVDDELHPARLVEEALRHERPLRRDGAERGARRRDVVDDLPRAGGRHGALRLEPGRRAGAVVEAPLELLAQPRDLGGELPAAAGRLGDPERDAGRGAVRVLDAHRPGFHPADAPRRVPEQEHVARHRLDREVLVHLADRDPLGLGDDRVLRVVGDGAAAGERGDARAAAPLHAAVHGVAVEQRRGAAGRGGDPLREHVDDRVELGAREGAVGPGAADEREEPVEVGSARRTPPRRSAARARRAAGRGCGSPRARRRAGRAPAPRTRGARRGSSGTAGPSARPPSRARRGRRAAARRGGRRACRAGRRGPPRRRRCRARAKRSRRRRGGPPP